MSLLPIVAEFASGAATIVELNSNWPHLYFTKTGIYQCEYKLVSNWQNT